MLTRPNYNCTNNQKEVQNVIKKVTESTEPKKTRKRLRKEFYEIWAECTSCAKSKRIVPAKIMKPPCSNKCKYKCINRITQEQRSILFDEYYNLIDINRKREFISRNWSRFSQTTDTHSLTAED
ncbi:unnamed protein product [Psylliodes chrysocephalus]|uniref:Uncharacterized protein n=1 Tax=Psylliodes chrysocephalus TaxID=3402493 RepID=A0A9P0GE90_9CUCU|nr:unnamed protein product [Psylliodes chrysocephala]